MNAGHPSDRAVLREPEAAVRERELLECAARAADIGVRWEVDFGCYSVERAPYGRVRWNPLASDGDALRLAVKLRITPHIDGNMTEAEAATQAADGFFAEPHIDDPFAATRRAIVRAAAAIGSELRKTASGCSHTARPDDQSKVYDQEPTAGSSHG